MNANVFTFNKLTIIPPIAPPIIAAYKGFLSFNVTPYNPGSDIPKKADIPVDSAMDLFFLVLYLKKTASNAPVCARLLISAKGSQKLSNPFVSIL